MIEIKAMFPVLVTENLQIIKAFYEAVFGFNSVFYDKDFYLHLLHPTSGVQLGFLISDHPSQPEFLHNLSANTGMVISLEVENAKSAWGKAVEMKLDVAMTYRQENWGQNHFMIHDPGGFVIDVVEQVDQ